MAFALSTFMRSRVPASAAAAFLLLPMAVWAEAASPKSSRVTRTPPAPPIFSERMTIREVEILVERPPERRMPKAADLKVLVDGLPRPVVRVENASEDAPWHLVIYVDRQLAGPATLFYSLVSLADQADTLTELGTVEVLEAGSDRPFLGPTRDARTLRWALGGLAAKARFERDRAEAGQALDRAGSSDDSVDEPSSGIGSRAADPSALTLASASRCLDRLVARLTERHPAGPHALFLVADGSDPRLAPPFDRAARLLAGYAWVTFPILIRKETTRSDIVTGPSDLEVFRRGSDAGSKNNMSIPGIIPSHKSWSTGLSIEGVVELLFDPEVAGFRALARETAGAVIGREAQVPPALARLGRRMRVWIDESDPRLRKSEDVAEEGKLRRLEVTRFKNDLPLRASAYLRASTPEELTATRLRLLLEGEGVEGGFDLEARWTRRSGDGASADLELSFDRGSAQEGSEEEVGPIRLTWGWLRADGELEAHSRLYSGQELKAQAALGRFTRSLAVVVPLGVERVGIVVDDLASERWGGLACGGK